MCIAVACTYLQTDEGLSTSPVFLMWLDVVHQVMRQFPNGARCSCGQVCCRITSVGVHLLKRRDNIRCFLAVSPTNAEFEFGAQLLELLADAAYSQSVFGDFLFNVCHDRRE